VRGQLMHFGKLLKTLFEQPNCIPENVGRQPIFDMAENPSNKFHKRHLSFDRQEVLDTSKQTG
jgi:hypothetical protein